MSPSGTSSVTPSGGFIELPSDGGRADGPFLPFLMNQLIKVEEQNEWLKSKILQLAKEQEEYYLDGQKRMDIGFRDVAKCVEEVSSMKDVFKEIMGIMSGERVRFVNTHDDENVINGEVEGMASTLLNRDSGRETEERRRQYEADCMDLSSAGTIKTEENTRISNILRREVNHEDGDEDHNYKINRSIQSVHDVAREYFEGLPGKPSLISLGRRYGSTWRRSSKERTLFAKRMCIINRINDIRKNPTRYGLSQIINRNTAIKIVENIRLGNNNFEGHHCRLSLSQLYTYFSKKMDRPEDYSLNLITQGEPRRFYLMREREARLERVGSEEETNEGTPGAVFLSRHSTDE